MRSALIAAIVAAIVAAGGASAASMISGRAIRPGSLPLNRLKIVRVAGTKTSVAPNGGSGSAVAVCPAGFAAIGGGGGSDYADLESSKPIGSNEWGATFYNYDVSLVATAQAFVICAKGA